MMKGEQSIVTIHPEYGYGSIEVKLDISIVPPNSNIIYEVEMLDFVKVNYFGQMVELKMR